MKHLIFTLVIILPACQTMSDNSGVQSHLTNETSKVDNESKVNDEDKPSTQNRIPPPTGLPKISKINARIIRLDTNHLKTVYVSTSEKFELSRFNNYTALYGNSSVFNFVQGSENVAGLAIDYRISSDGSWGVAAGGDIVLSLPSGIYQYGGKYKNSRNFVRKKSDGLFQSVEGFGTIELVVDFDKLTGFVSGYTMTTPSIVETTINGDININLNNGSYSGIGKMSGLVSSGFFPTTIVGTFHGNKAEGVSGIYYPNIETHKDVIGAFIASR